MQEQDIQAWEREIKHTQMMQKQREGWDGKQVTFAGGKTYDLPKTTKTTKWSNKNEK